FLLLVSAMGSSTWYLYLNVSTIQIKNEAKAALNKGNTLLEVLKIPKKYFARIPTGEITWKGKLYDIRSCEPTQDTLLLYVYHDCPEENLLHQITEFFQKDFHQSINGEVNQVVKNQNSHLENNKYFKENFIFSPLTLSYPYPSLHVKNLPHPFKPSFSPPPRNLV
ncbi:MAG: hypothetical protein ACYCOO_10760, partial [Chitinophagaceae bacterium]